MFMPEEGASVSEVDRPGYPGTGHGSLSAGPPTVEYPLLTARTDRSGGWEPPRKRHPLRLVTVLLVILVSVIAVGAVRIAWPDASAPLPWAFSAAYPWAPPAADVDSAVVNINTGDPNGHGAGTGIVLSPSGEVLTNNHVIDGATSITATDVGNGQTYPATVVGYDRSHDLAVLQLQGASGLRTAPIGDSSAVAVGDEIAAIGNAGGRGGAPTVTAGTVSALDQTVTVSDEITGSSQQLAGLIQVAADVQAGQSGGPLVNSARQVIGIVTAGSDGSRRQPTGGDGLAIPINDAIAISKQIHTGTASATVHIGATGILGVEVQDPTAHPAPRHRGSFGYRYGSGPPGALIVGVMPGSPAEQSGLSAGDVIVSVNAAPVDSPAALTTLLAGHHPGDMMRLAWLDASGQSHTATLALATGPPN